MKNKLKKKYIPFKKTIIPVLSILMIITAILLVVYTIDSKKFYKDHYVYDSKYNIRVLYLIMEEEKVPKDIDMIKTFDDPGYREAIITNASVVIPLSKKGDYLYADLDNYTNGAFLEKETDYVFAMLNNNGEVIDGCEYDKDKNVIKVPFSYYEGLADGATPIQVEIQSLLSNSKKNNYSVTANVKKIVTKTKKVQQPEGAIDTTIPIGRFGFNKLTEEDIHIYVNNYSEELSTDKYELDGDNVVLYISPGLIGKVDIKVDYAFSSTKAADTFRHHYYREKVDGQPTNLSWNDSRVNHQIEVTKPFFTNKNVGDVFYIDFTIPNASGVDENEDLNYCLDNDSSCDSGGWTSSYANWFYTYIYDEAAHTYGVQTTNYGHGNDGGLDTQIDDVRANNWADPNNHNIFFNGGGRISLMVFRVKLEPLIGKINDEQLASGEITDRDKGTKLKEDLKYYYGSNLNTKWLGFYCTEARDKAVVHYGEIMHFTVKVVAKDDNSIVLSYESWEKFTSQDANAYIKFHWDDTEVGLGVRKVDANNKPLKNLKIGLVDASSPNTVLEWVETDANGVAKFHELDADKKYKFIEDCSDSFSYDGDNSAVFGTEGAHASYVQCTWGANNPWGGNNGQGFTPTEDFDTIDVGSHTKMINNITAGLRVHKTDDRKGTAFPIQGLKITAVNVADSSETHVAYTDASGIADFGNLKLGKNYKFYESCSCGDGRIGSSAKIAYNGSECTGSSTLESAFDINCSYNSSKPLDNGGTGYTAVQYYKKDSSALKEMVDITYRYCAVAKKTKGTGTSKRNESDVTFRLEIPQGACRNYEHQTATTNASGLAIFNGLGVCRAGVQGTVIVVDDEHVSSAKNPEVSVDLVRTTLKVKSGQTITYRNHTYNAGDTILIADKDFETYANQVEEICPTTNVAEIQDYDYLLSWNKFDNSYPNRKEVRNASFNVYRGNTKIKANATKISVEDEEGNSRVCYEYNPNGAIDTFVSDGFGRTCISNLPNREEYDIVEVNNSKYYSRPINGLMSSFVFSDFTHTDYINYPYLIDFYKKEFKNNKTSNSDGKLINAHFNVLINGTKIKTKEEKELVVDENGTTNYCYRIDEEDSSNNTREVFVSDEDGYVCIMGLTKDTGYTVREIDPPEYYAYSLNNSINVVSKLSFSSNENTKLNNCPTEVRITKTTTELNGNVTDSYKRIVYEELQKLTFNVLDSEEHVLSFIWNPTSKHYEFADAVSFLKGAQVDGVTELRLLNGVNTGTVDLSTVDLDIIINYLPEGTYTLREASSKNCASSNNNPSSGSNCTCDNTTDTPGQATNEEKLCANMGYGHVADKTFVVSDTNNGSSMTCDKEDNAVRVSLTNKPTEVRFTKEDVYGYYNDTDKVKFENDEEIQAFDNITFRVRKKSTVTTSGTTSTDSSNYEWFYRTNLGEYRYDVLHKCSSEGQRVSNYTCTQNLHTDDGDMLLTHLCKCDEYFIEEYEVPDGSVFILPKLEGTTCGNGYYKVDKGGKLECHPMQAVKVCDCDDDHPESSPPVKIEDYPTKQVFVKRDLKYNTIILDTEEKARFELFLTTEEAAAAGRKCNPYDASSKANDCVQVYFSERVVLSDEADGSYSYRMNPNQNANNKIKELKLDKNTGKLIFRYLPSYIDREYVLMETVAPKGYDLPVGEKSVTRFTVANDTVNALPINVPNTPTQVLIGKYDVKTGTLIPGFKFKVYKVNNYDENLTAARQSRSSELSFRTVRDGSYEYREVFDTSVITTCIDKEGSPCSDLSNTLVDDNYTDTQMGIDQRKTTVKEGQALIQYLDENSWYVIEEVEAPEGYQLPERESDRFTMFYMPESEHVNLETKIYNTETYFTFFKYDEFNNVKDGAVFKLQKLNNDKIYEDVAVEDVSTEDTKMYKVLSTSENYEITTLNGMATIYRLTEGQYRILEVKAPEGYELPKKSYNVVTFLVDKNGHTYGNNVIANKKHTTHLEVVPKSQAELVVNIQTGQAVIKYGLIITGILGLIGLLIFIRKKISK